MPGVCGVAFGEASAVEELRSLLLVASEMLLPKERRSDPLRGANREESDAYSMLVLALMRKGKGSSSSPEFGSCSEN